MTHAGNLNLRHLVASERRRLWRCGILAHLRWGGWAAALLLAAAALAHVLVAPVPMMLAVGGAASSLIMALAVALLRCRTSLSAAAHRLDERFATRELFISALEQIGAEPAVRPGASGQLLRDAEAKAGKLLATQGSVKLRAPVSAGVQAALGLSALFLLQTPGAGEGAGALRFSTAKLQAPPRAERPGAPAPPDLKSLIEAASTPPARNAGAPRPRDQGERSPGMRVSATQGDPLDSADPPLADARLAGAPAPDPAGVPASAAAPQPIPGDASPAQDAGDGASAVRAARIGEGDDQATDDPLRLAPVAIARRPGGAAGGTARPARPEDTLGAGPRLRNDGAGTPSAESVSLIQETLFAPALAAYASAYLERLRRDQDR